MIEKSTGIDSEPPRLPEEDEELGVYVEYAAELDSFEAKFHDDVMSIFVKKQGHLAHLKGQALLRAKASTKVDVGWDAIFAAFGVKRSTGFVHIDIAETFSEDETKEIAGVNELREEAQRRRAAAGGAAPEDGEGGPPNGSEVPPSNMYSVKKARDDLKEAKRRLKRFADDIGSTSDAINNPQGTPIEFSSFEREFDDLKTLVVDADAARCKALSDLTATINELLVAGSEARFEDSNDEQGD